MLATLRQSTTTSEPVDSENGIVRGCILAESGKLAEFNGADGAPASVLVTPKLIDSLLTLATSEGRLDAYWTHDRLSDENAMKDAIHDSVGVWRNFRQNERGDLIADAELEPSDYREKILWKAQHDKQGLMTSLVFQYAGGRDDAIATRIISGDFVRFGAATTALLSKQTKPTMTKDEIEEIVSAKFAALSKEAEAKLAEVDVETEDEDKKDEPEDMPAVLRAVSRLSKASKRLTAKLAAAESENASLKAAIEGSADIAIAKFTSQLGKGKFTLPAQSTPENATAKFNAAVDELVAKGVKRSQAIVAAIDKNPQLYAESQQALFSAKQSR